MDVRDIIAHKIRITPEMALEGIEDITRRMVDSPTDSNLWQARAVLYDKVGQYGLAVQDMDVVIARRPEDDEPRRKQAIYLIRDNRLAEAIAIYDGLIEKHPQEWDLRRTRGNLIYRSTKDWAALLKDYWQAFRLGASTAAIMVGKLSHYFLPEVQAFVDEHPSSTDGLNILAIVTFTAHDDAKAIELLRQSFAIKPDLHVAILMHYIAVGNKLRDEAEAALKLAEAIDPKHTSVLIAEGYMSWNKHDPKAAIGYFNQALKIGVNAETERDLKKIIARLKKNKNVTEIELDDF